MCKYKETAQQKHDTTLTLSQQHYRQIPSHFHLLANQNRSNQTNERLSVTPRGALRYWGGIIVCNHTMIPEYTERKPHFPSDDRAHYNNGAECFTMASGFFLFAALHYGNNGRSSTNRYIIKHINDSKCEEGEEPLRRNNYHLKNLHIFAVCEGKCTSWEKHFACSCLPPWTNSTWQHVMWTTKRKNVQSEKNSLKCEAAKWHPKKQIWMKAQSISCTETEVRWRKPTKAKLIKHQSADVVKWLMTVLQNVPQ